jgi:hypothetical protein
VTNPALQELNRQRQVDAAKRRRWQAAQQAAKRQEWRDMVAHQERLRQDFYARRGVQPPAKGTVIA